MVQTIKPHNIVQTFTSSTSPKHLINPINHGSDNYATQHSTDIHTIHITPKHLINPLIL
jgi:hypothetical protein